MIYKTHCSICGNNKRVWRKSNVTDFTCFDCKVLTEILVKGFDAIMDYFNEE
jgi:hypothetical protein